MSLIKYYEIESDYLFFLSKLEQRLEKDIRYSVLDRNHTGCLAVGDNCYDSGNFNVLYVKSKKLGGLRFEKTINGYVLVPKRAGFTLVVKGDEENIGSLDYYLGDSSYEVNQANEVSHSVFSFTTFLYKDKIKSFFCHVKDYIKLTYPNLEKRLYLENSNESNKDFFCSGLVIGGVEDVLETRRFIMSNGFGIGINNESVDFRQDRPGYLIESRLLDRQNLLECGSEDESQKEDFEAYVIVPLDSDLQDENESQEEDFDNIIIDSSGLEEEE